MKQKILILLFIILHFTFFIGLEAQDTWIQTYDPFPGWQNPNYSVEDVVVCSDGGYAVNGTFNGFNFQEEFKWGFVVKTDCDGNMLWAKQDTIYNDLVHTTATGMIYTNDDCILSVGYSNNFGTYLIKRDLDGNRIWRRTMTDFTIRSLDTTNDGNIILGGSQNLNIALRKIDEEGDIFWTQVFPIDDDYSICNSIVSLNDGGYALTGFIDYEERTDFDVLVMKTDANGDSLWTRTYDGFGDHDEGLCIIENYNGYIFVSGYFQTFNRTVYGFFIKYTNDGEVIFFLDENNSENFYLFRSMTEDNYYDRIIGFGRNESEPALNFYDYNGLNLWDSSLTIDNSGRGDKSIKHIQSGFICVGEIEIELDDYIIMIKTNEIGQYVDIEDEVITISNDLKLFNYPNPFNPSTKISYDIVRPTNVDIIIYNAKGQIVKTLFSDYQNAGKHFINWNGTDKFDNTVSSGVYYIQLNAEDKQITNKVLLLK